jgi:acyl CoA:acetate/3-ketoacid CoA transferase alpha subunit
MLFRDREGNLRYAKTARNFNHVMATAAKVTIAEVENLVEAGDLDGNDVQTPGVYVHRMVKVPRPQFEIKID